MAVMAAAAAAARAAAARKTAARAVAVIAQVVRVAAAREVVGRGGGGEDVGGDGGGELVMAVAARAAMTDGGSCERGGEACGEGDEGTCERGAGGSRQWVSKGAAGRAAVRVFGPAGYETGTDARRCARCRRRPVAPPRPRVCEDHAVRTSPGQPEEGSPRTPGTEACNKPKYLRAEMLCTLRFRLNRAKGQLLQLAGRVCTRTSAGVPGECDGLRDQIRNLQKSTGMFERKCKLDSLRNACFKRQKVPRPVSKIVPVVEGVDR